MQTTIENNILHTKNPSQSPKHSSASPCGERRIKVHRFFYENRRMEIESGCISPAVPWIQIKGHWLTRVGFIVGAKLKVRVMPGCLVLTVENE